jgi:hypothetical protein
VVEVPVDEVMLNWFDWARMVVKSCGSLTKLTWKPLPTGNPELGAGTVNEPVVPSTCATRISWPVGKTPVFYETPDNEAGCEEKKLLDEHT